MLAYANSLSGEFVWDDKLLVESNEHIENVSYVKQVMTEDIYHSAREATGYYRPAQIISYMFDYSLWERNPLGYHLSSLIIQVLNSIIVFYICLLILGGRLKSLFVSSVFCVHPAFVPIVGYISGRADLLGFFFGALTIYLALKYLVQQKGAWTLPLGVLFYIFAILSKEYYVISPLFIILYLWVYRGELELTKPFKAFLFQVALVTAAYLFLRLTTLNFHQEMGGLTEFSFMERFLIFPYVLTRYLLTLIFPFDLAMERKVLYSSLTEARFLLSYITLFLLVFAAGYFYRKGKRRELFFLGWFAVGIIPVSNLFMPLKTILADHWTYMPSLGIFALLALAADRPGVLSRSKTTSGKLKLVLAVFIVTTFAVLTIRENRFWRGEESLFLRIMEKSPASARAHINMGKLYEERGDYKKALEYFNAGIERNQNNAGYFHMRGHLHRKAGNLPEARSDFEAAVRIKSSVAVYHNDLGGIYAELGMIDRARDEWKRALELNPRDELAQKNLEMISRSRN